ncbi:MAG: hypothetical protein WC453_04425 [Patescibacteria group bacterium]
MKNSKLFSSLIILLLAATGCHELPTAAEDNKTTRFLVYNMTITDNGAWQEEYLLLLPGLKETAQPEQRFINIDYRGDTLRIVREYYPENADNIQLYFSSLPKDDINLLINDAGRVFINPDRIAAVPETPGLSGNGGLRFAYAKSWIYQGNLSLLDTLEIYYLDGTWRKLKIDREQILTAVRQKLQNSGSRKEPTMLDPFDISVDGKKFQILIRPNAISALAK